MRSPLYVSGIARYTLHPAEPGTNIVKLIEHGRRISHAFSAASAQSGSPEFCQTADKIRQLLDQCVFELQTELRRMNIRDVASGDLVPAGGRCDDGLQALIAEYAVTVESHVPPHARAMLKRHQSHLMQAFEDCVEYFRAA